MSVDLSRGQIIALVAAIPLGVVAAMEAVTASDEPDDSDGTKVQFKYTTKPGPGGKACAACALFQAPSSCSIVKGKIAPTGYCTSFAPKS